MKEEEEGVRRGLTIVQDFDVFLKTIMMIFSGAHRPTGNIGIMKMTLNGMCLHRIW